MNRMAQRRVWTPLNLSVLIFCAIVVFCAQASAKTGTAEPNFYVSPRGNDGDKGKGTRGEPFRTISRARDEVRKLVAAGLKNNVHVWLRGGTYELREPLTFTSADSGSNEYSINYAAYKNEKPIVSGGQTIGGWTKGAGELWTITLPDVKNGGWNFRQLFVNGMRRTRARTPNAGFFNVSGYISGDTTTNFKTQSANVLPSWAERGDVEVMVLHVWTEFRIPIRSVVPDVADNALSTVTLNSKTGARSSENNARFWIENAPEALDSPGEWYLDRKSGVLSYWPLPNEDIRRAQFVAPRLSQLMILEGEAARPLRNLCFRGLTFSYADWTFPPNGYIDGQAANDIPATIQANRVLDCRWENCVVSRVGNYAVAFERGCKRNIISRCEMTDLGAGGVKIGEPQIRADEADKTRNNQITDCHIHDIGRVYPPAVGVWIAQSSGNLVAHNEIDHTGYTGISVGWTWGYGPSEAHDNIIEWNHVHHIGQGMLSDLGGIYTLGVQPGTVIRHNVFHDIEKYSAGYGGWGIYTDEGSSGILVENNLVYRTSTAGFHQHYGRENVVRNNIFAWGREAQIMRTREEDHRSFTFERNIVLWNQGDLLGSNWSNNQYLFDHNLYFDARQKPLRFKDWSWDEWQKRGQDVHSMVADPRFADAANGDFTLKSGSPAAQIGFVPLDLSSVGPRKVSRD